MFGVTILGSNSALPAHHRHPTAQIVSIGNDLLLIDCGEGTQMQINKYKVRHSKIAHIFISHLHGDHYFGLPGLLNSMALLGRTAALHLYAPAGLKNIIDTIFNSANTTLPYPLHFHPLEKEGMIVEEKNYTVACFKVIHRIECWGFFIKEKKKLRKINAAVIRSYDIPLPFYEKLKDGNDYVNENGTVIKNETVTIPNTPERSYAYCADTAYTESFLPFVANANLLYHEATYRKGLEEKAAQRYHSTTLHATEIARKASAKALLIGHFSSQYDNVEDFEKEAVEMFPNTQSAIEGTTFLVK
jgi:ribonuclease Z